MVSNNVVANQLATLSHLTLPKGTEGGLDDLWPKTTLFYLISVGGNYVGWNLMWPTLIS